MPPADVAPSGAAARRAVAIIRHPLAAMAKGVLDLHMTGREHFPDGPYVLAANHFSYVDPVVVSLAAGRNIRYLAVGGIFEKSAAFSRLLGFFGAVPLRRDRPPVGAVRTALEELIAGHPVGVFPESRRVSWWREEPARPGAAWLALAAGVPVVPVALAGSEGTLSRTETSVRRTSVRIWVEPPIDPLDFTGHEDPTAAIMSAWTETIGRRLDPWWPPSRRTHPPIDPDQHPGGG